jgi:protein-S-isoprenylcysteine O-methyltransferase Ste14
MAAKYISISATVVIIVAAGLLAFRQGLLANGPASATLQVAGLLLVLWARLTFGLRSFHYAANPTQGSLVTSGPYRFIRNPIYAAAWLIIWVGVAVHWSWPNACLGAVIAAGLALRLACEERLLRAAYPEYEEYAKRTARLIPFVI